MEALSSLRGHLGIGRRYAEILSNPIPIDE
jgi:hypothetical protein